MPEANDNTVLKIDEVKDFLAALKQSTRLKVIEDIKVARDDIAQDLKNPDISDIESWKLIAEERILGMIFDRANEVEVEWLQIQSTVNKIIKPASEGF